MLITDSDIKSTRSASGHKSAIAACGLLASTFAKVRRDCLSSSYANQSELNELNDNQLSRTIDELLSLGRRAGTVVLASNFSDVDDELSKKLTMCDSCGSPHVF